MQREVNQRAGDERPFLPLARFHLFTAHDPGEAAERIAETWRDHRSWLAARAPFRLTVNHVDLHATSLSFVECPNSIEVTTSATDAMYLQFPLSGEYRSNGQGAEVRTGPGQLQIFNAGDEIHLLTGGPSHFFVLRVDQVGLEHELAGLLNEAVETPPRFDRAGTACAGAAIGRWIRFLAEELDAGGELLLAPRTLQQLERSLFAMMLERLPHSASAALACHPASLGRARVRVVEEYIAAHLDQPLSLGELARVAGVGGRVLQEGFRHHLGVSPLRLARCLRLDRVRGALERPEPGASVTSVAMNFGFFHLGRFAVSYRERFGESPSMTLRHGRARCGLGVEPAA